MHIGESFRTPRVVARVRVLCIPRAATVLPPFATAAAVLVTISPHHWAFRRARMLPHACSSRPLHPYHFAEGGTVCAPGGEVSCCFCAAAALRLPLAAAVVSHAFRVCYIDPLRCAFVV